MPYLRRYWCASFSTNGCGGASSSGRSSDQRPDAPCALASSSARSAAKPSQVTRPPETSSQSASCSSRRSRPDCARTSCGKSAPRCSSKASSSCARGPSGSGAPPPASSRHSSTSRRARAADQREGRGPPRRSAPRRLVRARQPSPGDLAGEAELVEQRLVIARHPRRQDVALPGARGRLESLQLPQHFGQSLRAVELRALLHVLPAEQVAEEVLRGAGLDLAP